MFLRNSLIGSVNTPMPIAVKKLMLNLVLRGLSIGKMPAREGTTDSSFILSLSFFMPMP